MPEMRIGSTPQHLTALAGANRTRLAGAAARRRIAAESRTDGLLMAARMLETNPPDIQSLRVEWFLRSVHRTGKRLAAKQLDDAGITRAVLVRPMRMLSQRQRSVLAHVLRARAADSKRYGRLA